MIFVFSFFFIEKPTICGLSLFFSNLVLIKKLIQQNQSLLQHKSRHFSSRLTSTFSEYIYNVSSNLEILESLEMFWDFFRFMENLKMSWNFFFSWTGNFENIYRISFFMAYTLPSFSLYVSFFRFSFLCKIPLFSLLYWINYKICKEFLFKKKIFFSYLTKKVIQILYAAISLFSLNILLSK